MSWWMQLIACLVATAAYSVLVKLPWNTMVITACIGAAGYGLFLLLGQGTIGYFAGALLMGLSCEICARLMKRTATLFMTGAIIPLVPGVGLYRTMRYVVEGNATMAVEMGTSTLLGLCSIALAMTITTVLFANFNARRKRKGQAI